MKKMKSINLVALVALLLSASTQLQAETSEEGVYRIKAPRFARPLVEKWITDYHKVDSRMRLEIAGAGEKADISFSIYKKVGNADDDNTVWFGQYAILPVTARQGEAAKYFSHHRLSKKKLRDLFFIVDEFDNTPEKDKQKRALVAYSCSHAHCLASAYASYFGQTVASLKGKKISGDDAFLTTAINRDHEGISFNALYNLYDLDSRHLKSDVSLIPLDVKKQQAQQLTDEATLDGLIALLEHERVDGIPVEPIGLSVSAPDERLSRFLNWVVTIGKEHNHEFGLLNLDDKTLAAETGKLNRILTAQK